MAMHLAGLKHITKGHIVNQLIHTFRLKSYFEYNKFDGQSFFADIECEFKEIAFIPERFAWDANNAARLWDSMSQFSADHIVAPEKLLEYVQRRFDLIMFDPVHVRPEVDETLKILLSMLEPGGFLVMHDCSPECEEHTARVRTQDAWVGETYKAFAAFRRYNSQRALTVAEDYGVAVIWNRDLNFDYPTNVNLRYADMDADRPGYLGLMSYAEFSTRLAVGKVDELFFNLPQRDNLIFTEIAGQDVATGLRTICQLFWCYPDKPYSESDSLSQPLFLNGKTQTLKLELPSLDMSLAGLRFDFANHPCGACLQLIQLYDDSGLLRWTWSGDAEIFKNAEQMRLLQLNNSTILMIAQSRDPHAELAIPVDVQKQIATGWSFKLNMSSLAPDLYMLICRQFDLEGELEENGRAIAAVEKRFMDQYQAIQCERDEIHERLRYLESKLAEKSVGKCEL